MISYPDCDEDSLARIDSDKGGQPRLKDPLAPKAFSLPAGPEDDSICRSGNASIRERRLPF